VKKTRHQWHKEAVHDPATLPSYLRPPVLREVVFDPSLRRAGRAAQGA